MRKTTAVQFALLAAAVLASGADAGPPAACSPRSTGLCANTNELVTSRSFERALRNFLAGARANDLYAGNHLVAEQAIDVLGGPPDPPARIGTLWRFTACRAQSCTEKGAVVLRGDGQIVAIGILHSLCGLPKPQPDCSVRNVMSVHIAPAPESQRVETSLAEWAKTMVEAENRACCAGLPPARLDRVEYLDVPGVVGNSRPKP